MYTLKDARQFETVVSSLADNGAIHRETGDTAVKAVYARLDGDAEGEELISRAEAARLLKCSLKTVDHLCNAGKLTRIRTSKRAIRIRLSELRQMLGI